MRIGKNGFTLIELIIAIAVLGILSAVSYPAVDGYVEQTRTAVDLNNLGTLNLSTAVYDKMNSSPNPFDDSSNSYDHLMQVLVDNEMLDKKLSPQQKDISFKWDFVKKIWFMEGFTLGEGYNKDSIKGYSGSLTYVNIPKSIDGMIITQILQDAFRGKNLTSVIFPGDSSVKRIHARAFMNNNLTEIAFPDSIERIDYGAFLNNDIAKITIGSGVILEGNVFSNNNKFKEVYDSGGQEAGTYLYVDADWIKQ